MLSDPQRVLDGEGGLAWFSPLPSFCSLTPGEDYREDWCGGRRVEKSKQVSGKVLGAAEARGT